MFQLRFYSWTITARKLSVWLQEKEFPLLQIQSHILCACLAFINLGVFNFFISHFIPGTLLFDFILFYFFHCLLEYFPVLVENFLYLQCWKCFFININIPNSIAIAWYSERHGVSSKAARANQAMRWRRIRIEELLNFLHFNCYLA